MRIPSSPPRGFTLIELLVGIAVASILLGIGIPAFTDIIRNNRIASDSNELVTLLTFARSEAMKRGVDVSVCPRSGNTCLDSLDWSSGALVFTDDSGVKGALDASDVALQTSTSGTSGVSITSTVKSVTYQPNNGVLAEAVISISQTGCKQKNKREITVKATGRASLQKVTC